MGKLHILYMGGERESACVQRTKPGKTKQDQETSAPENRKRINNPNTHRMQTTKGINWKAILTAQECKPEL